MINNKNKLAQRASGVVFFGLFLCYGWLAGDIQLDLWAASETFTARTFPYLIAAAGAAVSVLYAIQPTVSPVVPLDKRVIVCALLVLLLGVYSVLIDLIGYPLASVVMLTSGFILLGERRVLLIGLIGVGVVAALYGLLYGLGIHIDAGVLRGVIQ